MKIAVVQLKSSKEDIEFNYNRVVSFISDAVKEGAKIVCFPEMTLCGYNFENLSSREKEQKKYLDKLTEICSKNSITALVGGIEREKDNYYIVQYIISDKIESYRKTHLGEKEKVSFTQGESLPVFTSNGVTFGIMLCYDSHFPEVCTKMALNGAKIIFNPSANGNNPEKRVNRWNKYLPARGYDNRVWVVATNMVFEKTGGGIAVYNGDGELETSSTAEGDTLTVFDYNPKEYGKEKMCNRNFLFDRRPEIYG